MNLKHPLLSPPRDVPLDLVNMKDMHRSVIDVIPSGSKDEDKVGEVAGQPPMPQGPLTRAKARKIREQTQTLPLNAPFAELKSPTLVSVSRVFNTLEIHI